MEQVSKEEKRPKPCPKCNGQRVYSPSWYVGIYIPDTITGKLKPHRKAVSKVKAEAIAYEAKLIATKAAGETIDVTKRDTSLTAGKRIFLQWVDDQVTDGNMSDGTARPYHYRLETVLSFLEGQQQVNDLRQITEDTADDYKRWRRCQIIYESDTEQRTPTPATINRELATLKRLLAVCKKKKLIKDNPLEGYELLAENNERERYLTHEEIDALLAECGKDKYPPHTRILTVIGLNTGLRKEGVLGLRWSHIDFEKNEIERIVKHRRGKTPKVVRIPMTQQLRAELIAWRKTRPRDISCDLVVPSPKAKGQAMLVTSRWGFEWAVKEAGIEDFTYHDIRHTFATLFLEEYPDKIEILRDIMGHSSSYMTRRYAHITERARHTAMAGFAVGGRR
jgi:integrase